MLYFYGIEVVVHSHGGKGKPEGCLEPVTAVLKDKPHVFESYPAFNCY
jgi:hypothetical protein